VYLCNRRAVMVTRVWHNDPRVTRTKLLTRDPQTRFQICHLPVGSKENQQAGILSQKLHVSVLIIPGTAAYQLLRIEPNITTSFGWASVSWVGFSPPQNTQLCHYSAYQHGWTKCQSTTCSNNLDVYVKLKALGQCIPPPRHVLSVSRSGSGSRPKFNRFSLARCQPSLKISCKPVQKFLRKVTNRQTDKQTKTIAYPPWRR